MIDGQLITIHYMSAERLPPARAWYDRVMAEAAVKGWGVAELARRAGVGRPTIYGWRDNPGKPQAKSVNAVADALGIDRAEAVRLAGILDPAPERPQHVMRPGLYRQLVREVGEEDAAAVAEFLAERRRAGKS